MQSLSNLNPFRGTAVQYLDVTFLGTWWLHHQKGWADGKETRKSAKQMESTFQLESTCFAHCEHRVHVPSAGKRLTSFK